MLSLLCLMSLFFWCLSAQSPSVSPPPRPAINSTCLICNDITTWPTQEMELTYSHAHTHTCAFLLPLINNPVHTVATPPHPQAHNKHTLSHAATPSHIHVKHPADSSAPLVNLLAFTVTYFAQSLMCFNAGPLS